MKIYLVTYSPTPPFNQAIFRNHVMSLFNNRHITDWWHYIDSTYLIASNLNADQLYNLIIPAVPKRNLLIIEIDKNNAQGWLPPLAWAWIKKYLGEKQS